MIIENKANLTYKEIGAIIDELQKTQTTNYYGKVELVKAEVNNKKIIIEIIYMKRYCKLIFRGE